MLNIKPKSSNIRERAFGFSLIVIDLVQPLPSQKLYWIIGDQLLRSSTSIGANLVEAKASSSRKDFIRYYEIALKSANETKYWLCLLRELNRKHQLGLNIEVVLQEAIEIANMIGSSLLTLKMKK